MSIDERFGSSCREMMAIAKKTCNKHLGVGDKYLLKLCLEEVFLRDNMNTAVGKDQASRALAIYANRYDVSFS